VRLAVILQGTAVAWVHASNERFPRVPIEHMPIGTMQRDGPKVGS
jgi:hypothetical protein